VFAALFLPDLLDTVRGGRVLIRSLQPVDAFADRVTQREILVELDGLADVPMTLYTPTGSEPETALVLVHGATPQGRHDSRLRSLACALALSGATVACPQLDSLAAFSVDARDIDRLVAATLQVARQHGAGPVGLVGISIGGSYALVAAGRPELAGQLSALLTFGAAADVSTSVVDWLAEPGANREPALQGRRDLLLANLSILVPADDVQALRQALRAPGPALAQDLPVQALGPASRTALAMGRDPDLADGATVRAVFAPLIPVMEAVSPAGALLPGDVPVFLSHAIADPLVPLSHLSQLAFLLDEAGADVQLEVTDVFSHVDAVSDPSWLSALPLARFVGHFLDAAGG